MKCALIFVFTLFVLHTNFEECSASTEVMKIEERVTLFDEMNALSRLPGDILRSDFVGAAMDGIILFQFLPLPWPILYLLSGCYTFLKFIQPAYWWLFPSTKPANVQGYGFQSLFG